MPSGESSDVLVIGGGVIGLSIAYELACEGVSVTLLERGEPGREASWAGAGVLPPASWYVDNPHLDRLAMEAAADQPRWSERLREETGIDDEYWRCGARYLATPENADLLAATRRRWRSLGVELGDDSDGGFLAPTEAQVRNPRRLRAVLGACRARGVRVVTQAAVTRFEMTGSGEIDAVATPTARFTAGAYCLAAGCWTPSLVEAIGERAPGAPVRGQMLLLRPPGRPLDQVVHRYPHYAVPRRDGLVLVGATVEHRGFVAQTTEEARSELIAAAERIDPRLGGAAVERHWAGLRPASADPLPLIGRLSGCGNAWVATGHHRAGLQLAPPTARLISAQVRGVACDLPADPFDPARFADAASSSTFALTS